MSENEHDNQRVQNPNVQFLGSTNTINNTPQNQAPSRVIPIVTDANPRSQDCLSVERNGLPVPVHTNIPLPTCYHYPHLAVCPGHYEPVVGHSNSQWDYNINSREAWATGLANIPYEKAGGRCNHCNCVCTVAATDPVWSATTNLPHYNSVLPSDLHGNVVLSMDYAVTQNSFIKQKNYEKEVENFLKKITSSKKDCYTKDSIEPKNKDASPRVSTIKNTLVSKDGKINHEKAASEPRMSIEEVSGKRTSVEKIDSSVPYKKNKKASKEQEMKDIITSPKPKKKSTSKENKKKISLSLKKKTCNNEDDTDMKNKSKKNLLQNNKVSKKTIVKKKTVKKIDKIQKQLQLVEEEIKKRRIDLQLKEKEINDELKTKIKYDDFVEEPYIPPPKKTKINIEENRQIITKYKIDKRPLSTIENEKKCTKDEKFSKQSIKTNKIKSVVKVPKRKVITKSKTDKSKISNEIDIRDKTVKSSKNSIITDGKSSPNFKEHSRAINIQYKDHSQNTNCNDLSVMIERGKEDENKSFESNNTLELRIRLFTNPPQPVAQDSNCDVEKENSSSSDLSFLDDIDVDEIVEILNISDEQNKNNKQNVSEPFTLNLIPKEQKLQMKSDNIKNNNLPITEQANKNMPTREPIVTNKGDESANQLPSEDVNYDELREILKMVQSPQKFCTDESKSFSDEKCYGDSEADHDMGIFKELEAYRKQNNLTRAESEISDKTLVIDEKQYLDDVIIIEDDVSKNIIEISEDHDDIITENSTSGIENELMDEEATERRVKTFLESIMRTINKPARLQDDCKILESQENSQLKCKDTNSDASENGNITMPDIENKKSIVQEIDLTIDEDYIEQTEVLVTSCASEEIIELDKGQHKIISTVVISENSVLKGNEILQGSNKNNYTDQAIEMQSSKPEFSDKISEPVCENGHFKLLTNNQDDAISQGIEEKAKSQKHSIVAETKDQKDLVQIQVRENLSPSINETDGYDSDKHNEHSGQCSIGTITDYSNETLINEIISEPTAQNTIIEIDTEDLEIQSNEENYSTAKSNDGELIKAIVKHAVVETVADKLEVESDENEQCSAVTLAVSNVDEIIKETYAKPTKENNKIEIVAEYVGIHKDEACSTGMQDNKDQSLIKLSAAKPIVQITDEKMVAKDPEMNKGKNCINVTQGNEERKTFAKTHLQNTDIEMVAEYSEIHKDENCSTGSINVNSNLKLIKETTAKSIVQDKDAEMDAEVSEIEIDNVKNIITKYTHDNLNNDHEYLEKENETFEVDKIVVNSAAVVETEVYSENMSKSIQKSKQRTGEKDVSKEPKSSIEKIIEKPDIAKNNKADSDPQPDSKQKNVSTEIIKYEKAEPAKVEIPKNTEQVKNIISDKINTKNIHDNLKIKKVERSSKTCEAKTGNGNRRVQTKMEVLKELNKSLQTKAMVKNTAETSPGAISGETDEKDVLTNVIESRLFEYLHKKFSVTELIHNGNFSNVYLCESKTCENIVAKILSVQRASTNRRKRREAYYDSIAKEETLKEILQEHGDGTNIVKLYNGLSVDGRWCFLFEYYPQNLEQALREREKRSFHIDTIQLYARQLLTAVLFLRKHDQVHSAIKPGHILINEEEAKLKLCGFDEMCYIDQIDDSPNQGCVHYRPPEVILGYCKHFAIDVWSAGLIIYEMATNMKLFHATVNSEVLFQQMLNFGSVPPYMRKKSLYRTEYYRGPAFIRPVVKKDNSVHTYYISKHFNWTFKFGNKVLTAYERDWARARIDQAGARYKVQQMLALLKDMLVMDPNRRTTIEFAYAHPFIYEYNSTRAPLLPLPY